MAQASDLHCFRGGLQLCSTPSMQPLLVACHAVHMVPFMSPTAAHPTTPPTPQLWLQPPR